MYNYDPATGDARNCGTTASLCGVEQALEKDDKTALDYAVKRDLLLHTAMAFLQGFPRPYPAVLSCRTREEVRGTLLCKNRASTVQTPIFRGYITKKNAKSYDLTFKTWCTSRDSNPGPTD